MARGDGVVNLYRARGIGLQLIKSVATGKRPGEMCLDPNGKRISVGQMSENRVAELDLASQSVVATMIDPELKTRDGQQINRRRGVRALVDHESRAKLAIKL